MGLPLAEAGPAETRLEVELLGPILPSLCRSENTMLSRTDGVVRCSFSSSSIGVVLVLVLVFLMGVSDIVVGIFDIVVGVFVVIGDIFVLVVEGTLVVIVGGVLVELVDVVVLVVVVVVALIGEGGESEKGDSLGIGALGENGERVRQGGGH
ncbi:hypothetical protein BCR39DRAFT_252171 [Naematelia encephala]|uniref:Uncharacterized protein n=1 Tax=Naematelia encephala TaxID=71784 RepID=A0A1Y2AVT2_9TREE|nr:hypothetical protein BCR39DRAFT_252171 [Naematelia encephala]